MPAERAQPGRLHGAPRFDVVNRDRQARFTRKLDVTAGQEAPGTRQSSVSFDEIIARDAITIGEDQILARRGQNGAVENLRFAEATVFVPHMHDIESGCGGDTIDDLSLIHISEPTRRT